MWYLSPREFCQWSKAVELRPPARVSCQTYSELTTAGKQKQKSKGEEPLVPGVDYVVDFDLIRRTPGAYAYPAGKDVYAGPIPESHNNFHKIG